MSRRILFPLGTVLIVAFSLYFAWPSLAFSFDADDMFNLFFGWNQTSAHLFQSCLVLWTGEYRPFGFAFYRLILEVAGFTPLPFRIAELTFCLLNTGVCFWFTRLVSRSERTAALAALFFSFHVGLLEAWYRTTVIVDVLCFAFSYLAAGLYIESRREGGDLRAWRIAAILLCFICALDSKEFAVALPAVLVAWEVIFNRERWRSFLKSRSALTIALMGILTVAYAYGKLHGPAAMSNNPAYAPQYTIGRLAATWGSYLGDLFVLKSPLAGPASLIAMTGMLVVALLLRSRLLIFGWTIAVVGLAPVMFSPPRGGFEMYFSFMGWVIYAAGLLVKAQDGLLLLLRRWQLPRAGQAAPFRTGLACLVFLLAGGAYAALNVYGVRSDPRPWLYFAQDANRTLITQMRALHPRLSRGSRVMFVEDGIGWGEWTPLYIMRILYDDPTMVVDRLKVKTAQKPDHWQQFSAGPGLTYDHVFTYDAGRYMELTPQLAAIYGVEVRPPEKN